MIHTIKRSRLDSGLSWTWSRGASQRLNWDFKFNKSILQAIILRFVGNRGYEESPQRWSSSTFNKCIIVSLITGRRRRRRLEIRCKSAPRWSRDDEMVVLWTLFVGSGDRIKLESCRSVVCARRRPSNSSCGRGINELSTDRREW